MIKFKLHRLGFFNFVPSFNDLCSMACPTGKIVFMKIPILPLGESIPPTTLNPSPFLPTILKNL